MQSNDFSNYQDTVENTDGIYTGFSEEIPYERKTEDEYLDIPKTEGLEIIPLLSPKTGKNKKTGKKKEKKTRKNKKKKRVISKIYNKRGKTLRFGAP